jgi:hypothetical protein
VVEMVVELAIGGSCRFLFSFFFFSLLLSVLCPSPLLFFSFCSLAVAVLHGSGATVVATGSRRWSFFFFSAFFFYSVLPPIYSFSHSLVVLLFLWCSCC